MPRLRGRNITNTRRKTKQPSDMHAHNRRAWRGIAQAAIAYRHSAVVGDPSVQDCLRLIDEEIPGVSLDRYGDCGWFSWTRTESPSDADIAILAEIARSAGLCHWLVDVVIDRGRDPNRARRFKSDAFPEQWQAQDAGLAFELRSDSGLSPGLFLDQRRNKVRLFEQASEARVLNLFSYTCAFSVAAAVGGAEKVVSVDISKSYCEWGRRNFRLNGIDDTAHLFWHIDVRDYLKMARKKGMRFDIIIIDPPSFSRGPGRLFKIRNELPILVEACVELLNANGCIMASTNLRTWRGGAFRDDILRAPNTVAIDKPAVTPLPPDFTTGSTASKVIWVALAH